MVWTIVIIHACFLKNNNEQLNIFCHGNSKIKKTAIREYNNTLAPFWNRLAAVTGSVCHRVVNFVAVISNFGLIFMWKRNIRLVLITRQLINFLAIAEDCSSYVLSALTLASVLDCEQFPQSNDPNVCLNLASTSTSVIRLLWNRHDSNGVFLFYRSNVCVCSFFPSFFFSISFWNSQPENGNVWTMQLPKVNACPTSTVAATTTRAFPNDGFATAD